MAMGLLNRVGASSYKLVIFSKSAEIVLAACNLRFLIC